MAELILLGGVLVSAGVVGGTYRYIKKQRKRLQQRVQETEQRERLEPFSVQCTRVLAEECHARGSLLLTSDQSRRDVITLSLSMRNIVHCTGPLLSDDSTAPVEIPPCTDWKTFEESTHGAEATDATTATTATVDDEGGGGGEEEGDFTATLPTTTGVGSNPAEELDGMLREYNEDLFAAVMSNTANNICFYFGREEADGTLTFAGLIVGQLSRAVGGGDDTALLVHIDSIFALRGDPSLVLLPLNGYDFSDLKDMVKQHFAMVEFEVDVEQEEDVVAFYEYFGFVRIGVTDRNYFRLKRVVDIS
jgi:hypothetical protein